MYEQRDTTKCLENAEFAMEQIARKPARLLPGKEKFIQQLQDLVASAFLDQVRSMETITLYHNIASLIKLLLLINTCSSCVLFVFITPSLLIICYVARCMFGGLVF